MIFPSGADSEPLREALAPLLDLRRAQAGKKQERFYREFVGDDGYREGESKVAFLARHGAGPGPADPEKVPYYLLLVGDPEAIPFSFQYQLDVQYAVGRVCFDNLEEYRHYAESVVAAETGVSGRRPRACFFAPANPGDPVTGSTNAHLVQPVAAGVRRDQPGWSVETVLGSEGLRAALAVLAVGAILLLGLYLRFSRRVSYAGGTRSVGWEERMASEGSEGSNTRERLAAKMLYLLLPSHTIESSAMRQDVVLNCLFVV